MKEEKEKANLKVIIDTNIFISFLINDNLNFISDLIRKEKIDLVISEDLLDEISRVAYRPKFRNYINKEKITLLISLLSNFGITVEVNSKVNVCRDVNDNFLLALAKDSSADFLITGDKDLLHIHKFGNTFILNISEFKQLTKNL